MQYFHIYATFILRTLILQPIELNEITLKLVKSKPFRNVSLKEGLTIEIYTDPV